MLVHFVLIHGAWHGGWCWDGVIDILEKLGHTAEAPTLPGNAKGDDRSNITFDSYVQKIENVIEKQPEPVILVGHSSAGFLLQSAAPKVPDRIERLIFHNAAILANKMGSRQKFRTYLLNTLSLSLLPFSLPESILKNSKNWISLELYFSAKMMLCFRQMFISVWLRTWDYLT